jgi:hypothetical protein
MKSTSEELPEYQIFHILKLGEQQPTGPFSQRELLALLNDGEIHVTDLVYYSELRDWMPISEVFEVEKQLTRFGDEGQDPEIVAQTFGFIESRREDNEEIYYIAVQNIPALSLTATVKLRAPRSVVLTSRRFCIVKPKLMSDISFEEFPLDEISNAEIDIDSGADSGAFEIVPRLGERSIVDQIPVAQLARLEQISGELLA